LKLLAGSVTMSVIPFSLVFITGLPPGPVPALLPGT
jgi:hypothetical protein